jgi:hypothetical protein
VKKATAPVEKATAPVEKVTAPAEKVTAPAATAASSVPESATVGAPGVAPDAAALTAAWSQVLDGLKGATKGIFRDGEITEVDGSTAVLALPKGPPADLLEQRRPEVEAALKVHFGHPITLRLVIGDPHRPESAVGTPPAASDDDDDVHDVDSLEDAPAAGDSAQRLSAAFPGAELVEEP